MSALSNRADQIASRLDDRYEITLTFHRYLSEDLDYALERRPQAFETGLVDQVVAELREASANGLPGWFEISAIHFRDLNEREHIFKVIGEDRYMRLEKV